VCDVTWVLSYIAAPSTAALLHHMCPGQRQKKTHVIKGSKMLAAENALRVS